MHHYAYLARLLRSQQTSSFRLTTVVQVKNQVISALTRMSSDISTTFTAVDSHARFVCWYTRPRTRGGLAFKRMA